MKKICIKCGAEFEAQKPHLDKTLCDECAAKSANRTAKRNRVCGKEYIVDGGNQRYCPDCAPLMTGEVISPKRKDVLFMAKTEAY